MNDRKKNRSGQNSLPLILIVLGLFLVGGVLAWQFFGTRQQNPANEQPTATEPPRSDIPFPDIKRVKVDEAKAAYDNQSAVFIDVRGEDSYNEAHISGAMNIPLAQIESRAGELDPNKWIILYCT